MRAKEDIQKQETENKEFKKKLEMVKKPQFFEEEARNKLFLAKPGEGIIVLPEDVLNSSMSGKKESQDNRQNWQKWWDMFF